VEELSWWFLHLHSLCHAGISLGINLIRAQCDGGRKTETGGGSKWVLEETQGQKDSKRYGDMLIILEKGTSGSGKDSQ